VFAADKLPFTADSVSVTYMSLRDLKSSAIFGYKLKRMDNIDNDHRVRPGRKRIWVPLGLVLIGCGLFLNQMGLPLPYWLFTWQMLLIVIGIIMGFATGFRGGKWLILILIGSLFLLDEFLPNFSFHRFLWPAGIIIVGIFLMIRPGRYQHRFRHWHDWQDRMGNSQPGDPGYDQKNFTGSGKNFSSDGFIDATTVFGGVHRTVVSKDFKGGDITVFMGGTEINLSQADIIGIARLDITQIMGGTKLIVPAHWEIRSELTTVFGNIEDKRQQTAVTNPDKVLIIDGTSIFGGIEIRNY
jgi:predicted membrane protein